MRRLWLALLILAGIALAQNLELSIDSVAYRHWCESVHETQGC